VGADDDARCRDAGGDPGGTNPADTAEDTRLPIRAYQFARGTGNEAGVADQSEHTGQSNRELIAPGSTEICSRNGEHCKTLEGLGSAGVFNAVAEG
jgi:hypothetical protein